MPRWSTAVNPVDVLRMEEPRAPGAGPSNELNAGSAGGP